MCVQPRAGFFPRTEPPTRRHTPRRWGPHTLTGSRSLGQRCSSQVLSQPCGGEEQRDQETKSGVVSCPAGLGRSWRPTPSPHPLGGMSGAPTSARSTAWPTTAFPSIRNTNRSPGLPHPAQGAVPNISWAFPAPHLALEVTDALGDSPL